MAENSSYTQASFAVWNRLEPSTRQASFEKSLKAEIRDPLWMLTRQWQFGEFMADNAGSPVFAKVRMQTSPLHKLSLNGGSAIPYNEDLTLETHIEREAVPIEFDIALRHEMGRHWMRLLKYHLKDAAIADNDITLILDSFYQAQNISFATPSDSSEAARFLSRKNTRRALAALQSGRAVDGSIIYLHLLANPNNKVKDLVNYSSDPAIITIADAAATAFTDWFKKIYQQPESNAEKAWNPSRLTYEFACSVPEADGSMSILEVEDYHQGKLDSFAFNMQKDMSNVSADLQVAPAESGIIDEAFSFIPAPIKFAGMPNARWWEFEDSIVDLGNLDAHTTDMGKLIFAEFGLIYSNDWFVLPYDVKAGSLCRTKDLVVTDVFGNRTRIEASLDETADNSTDWSLFGLTNQGAVERDHALFVPPSIAFMQQSEARESVNFIRDEMANMVWAVEKDVPNDLGGSMDGRLAGAMQRTYLKNLFETEEPVSGSAGDLRYRMESEVPENWIPFVPARRGGIASREVQLRRAAMSRYITGLPEGDKRIRPKTSLLRENFDEDQAITKPLGPYFIHEEEVSRAGTYVFQTWQRSRTENGGVLVWLGRRRRSQRKVQGSVTLEFDRLEQ